MDKHVVLKITKKRRDNTIKIVTLEQDESQIVSNSDNVTHIMTDQSSTTDQEIIDSDGVTVKIEKAKNINVIPVAKPLTTVEETQPILEPPNLTGENPKDIVIDSDTTKITTDITTKKQFTLSTDVYYESESSDDDENLHYLALLPVGDCFYNNNNDPPSPFTKFWLYNIHLLTTYGNNIPMFPLDEIEDGFKYKTYIKKILKQEWKIHKRSIHTIKHVFTQKNVHFYMVFLNSRLDARHIKTSLNVTNKDEICWKDYLIQMPIDQKPKPENRPYQFKYPELMKSSNYIFKFPGKKLTYGLEEVFNLITELS